MYSGTGAIVGWFPTQKPSVVTRDSCDCDDLDYTEDTVVFG